VAGVARKLAVPIPTTPGLCQRPSVGVMGSIMSQSRPGDDEKPSRQLYEFLWCPRPSRRAIIAPIEAKE